MQCIIMRDGSNQYMRVNRKNNVTDNRNTIAQDKRSNVARKRTLTVVNKECTI